MEFFKASSFAVNNSLICHSEGYFILMAPELKLSQTPKENKFPTGHAFEIILPNLIHKSKKRNLR
ncbi:MAG: hypothetical protein A3A10_03115 [Candidatus Tagabacteria bacterium RIFCSPLOWO2_01_FULL_42_9]|uniref:Uncharacterized protein n=1 Tax=Candidatus Tagabacteria bacterium RIFCSPLOWO2_01_FULL_42_9 TaxID=1802296 RepID=A0A1G2LTD4_9BACT|nr:MAG: hypothetical protein A3A10_03115 [Candidatus Tagabacteria bacterium RIFCSPLOWO2_01_FULL_42_9]